MTSEVTCTACGATVGRGPGGLGIIQHWNKHRRDYAEAHPDHAGPVYKEQVREWLGATDSPRTLPADPEVLDDEQAQLDEYTFQPASSLPR